MPGRYDNLREYSVILRHSLVAGSPDRSDAERPEFTAILNAMDEEGAQNAAEALVLALRSYVTVVSITRI